MCTFYPPHKYHNVPQYNRLLFHHSKIGIKQKRTAIKGYGGIFCTKKHEFFFAQAGELLHIFAFYEIIQ